MAILNSYVKLPEGIKRSSCPTHLFAELEIDHDLKPQTIRQYKTAEWQECLQLLYYITLILRIEWAWGKPETLFVGLAGRWRVL